LIVAVVTGDFRAIGINNPVEVIDIRLGSNIAFYSHATITVIGLDRRAVNFGRI
jgi:hypothetical protein